MRAPASLFLLFSLASLCRADLPGDLTGAGIDAVFPGDPAYAQDSRAYNLRFTVQPAAVTFPTCAYDVSKIVSIGASYNVPVVARSGGVCIHSYIANGLGGNSGALVIDLRKLSKITVDSGSGTATIQPGNRLGDVALALNKKGRALPHGTCPYVGIGGHSSFGGFGFTSRMWGLTLDTVQSLDIVLANGTRATVSKDHYSDLFWAMRGAGPSFGITTAIKVKTFPAPPSATVFQYTWNLNPTDAANAVSSFQKFVQTNLPPEFDAEFVLSKGNDQGQVSFGLTGAWYASRDSFDAVIAPWLATVPTPDNAKFTVGSYIDSVTYLGGSGTLNTSAPDVTDTFYVKSLMTPEATPISDKALKAFMSYMAKEGFQTDLIGCRIELNSMWTIQFYASSPTFKPPYPSGGFTFLDDMVDSILKNSPSDWDIGAYPNYADNMLPNWQNLYYGSNYNRLLSLKHRYDPNGVFTFPESIGSQ